MSEQLTLSRATPAALYQQVKEHVLRKIAEGAWRAGDRVPSEQELVATFGVARMTVNRALRELAEQGSIVRVAGVGSFVAEEKPQSTLLRIAAGLIGVMRNPEGHDRADACISNTFDFARQVFLWNAHHAGHGVDSFVIVEFFFNKDRQHQVI